MDNVVSQAKNRMEKAFDVLREDFGTVRTGKAAPAIVENIVVMAYGGSSPLRILELATIHASDPHTLVISPFDKSIIGEISKAIEDAKIGLSPVVDSEIIRINLPALTEERRLEMVKMVHQKAENGRIMIRQIRHEGNVDVKKMGDAKTISEDEVERLEKEIQKLTDDFIAKIDQAREEKEKELMTI